MNQYDLMRGQSRGAKSKNGSNADPNENRSSIRREDQVADLLRSNQQPPMSSPPSAKTTAGTHRNQSSFQLGDGYNFFKQGSSAPPAREFHSSLIDRYKYDAWLEQRRISNIQFG